MTRRPLLMIAATGAALALATGATAATMHPELGAHLSGMGEHGVVNLQLSASSGKVCWTFDLPAKLAATAAAVHTGTSGATLFELGMHYASKGCAKEPTMTLRHLEAKPGSYSVWVNTKAHMGELRGALFAGMAHM